MLLSSYTPPSTKGKSDLPKAATIKVSDEIFGAKINQPLLAQAARVYLINQRQGTKHAKTRGEVTGTGRKIYRQKGTGRARHGDRLAPIFVKGGVAHGPKGNENYTKKLPKSMRRQALISAFSALAKDKRILIIDKLNHLTKTKQLHLVLRKILKQAAAKTKRVGLVVESHDSPLIRVSRNLEYVAPLIANQLTTYEILRHQTLVITADSLPVIEKLVTTK